MQLTFCQILLLPFAFFFNATFFLSGTQGQNIFPTDEAGNILYYEVVKTPELDKPQLTANGRSFFMELHDINTKKIDKQLSKKNGIVKWIDSSFTYSSENKYVLYPGKFLKHAIGEIKYDITIELKEGKYRYYFNKFKFIPYQLNRYGKYEPVAGKQIPLNQAILGKGQIKKEELQKIATYLESQVEQLKAIMKQQPTTTIEEEESKKIAQISEEW